LLAPLPHSRQIVSAKERLRFGVGRRRDVQSVLPPLDLDRTGMELCVTVRTEHNEILSDVVAALGQRFDVVCVNEAARGQAFQRIAADLTLVFGGLLRFPR
jgi:hypothetical protein